MTVLKRQRAEGRRQKWGCEVRNILAMRARTAAGLCRTFGNRPEAKTLLPSAFYLHRRSILNA